VAADLASLMVKVDATGADQAAGSLDRLTAAGQRTEAGMHSVATASKGAGAAAAEMAREAQRVAAATGVVGTKSGLASHHVANLSFQLQDMFIGLQAGQKPMTVFLQQGGQIAQIMGQAGLGVGGLAKAVGGMTVNLVKAHPFVAALAAAAVAATGAFQLFQGEIERSGEIEKFANSLGLTKKEMEDLGPVTVTLGDSFVGLWRTIDSYLNLSSVFSSIKEWAVDAFETTLNFGKVTAAGIYAAFVGTFEGIKAIWPLLPRVIGEAAVAAANIAIGAIESLLNRAIDGLNALMLVTNPILAAANMAGLDVGIQKVSFDRLQNQFAGAGAASAEAFAGGYNSAFNDAMAGMDNFGAQWADNTVQAAKDRLAKTAEGIIDDRTEKGLKKKAKKVADEFAEEFKRRVKEALSYIEGLEDQIAKFGKSALEIQRMEVAAAAAAAPTAALANEIKRLGANLEAMQIKQAVDDFDKMIIALYDEIELSGLVGKEREYRALQLERESKMAEWAALGLSDLEKRWLEYAAARSAAIETKSALERDAEAAERLNEQMEALLSSLSQMGGIGGLFGDIGSILTSKDPISSMLGMGGLGTIAGSLLGGKDVTDKMGSAFTKSLRTALPGLNEELAGKIGGTLAGIFQGSAIGGSVGGIMGGGKNAQLGSQVGGIAGQALGSSIAALGSLGGPIGAIAGAILGNVLGGLTQATKRGGATIGAGGVSGTWGNSQSRIGASSDMGTNAVRALEQLAGQLGATLGTFSSSISVREGNLRFDPTGSGISKTSKGAINFGQDEEALLKAVIADAIQDGAFQGLSQGFKDYLTSGDVEKRLQDVLSLRGVMNDAAEMRDPQAFALSELDTWRSSMMAIATATGEGMADIEYVYGKRREEILATANDNIVSLERDRTALLIQIAELEGRSTEALAMARELERSAVDESLRPLYDRIYALQDAAVIEAESARVASEAAAEAKRVSDERYGLETRFLQAIGDTDVLRARERDTISEANRWIFDLIVARESEQEATEAARRAEEDLARSRQAVAQEAYGLQTRLLQLQGDTATLREREMDALDPANRSLLQMIFNLEDLQAEASAAAAALETQRQAAADAAAKAKGIADERYGLETQLLTLQGNTAALRERELALLDPSNRAMQEQIWALEDQKAALEQVTKAGGEYVDYLKDARNALSDAYSRERSELEKTRDKFADFSKTIRDFRLGLVAANDNSIGNARARFLRTAAMAGNGDADAIGNFAGNANDFLSAAKDAAGSLVDYQRNVGFVANTALGLERQLGNQASAAQRQIDLLEAQVSQYIDLNENVVTVRQAIEKLVEMGAEKLPTNDEAKDRAVWELAVRIEDMTNRLEASEDMTRAALESIAISTARTAAIWKRIENEGTLAVSTRPGDTVAAA
jgi:hypothetical protein